MGFDTNQEPGGLVTICEGGGIQDKPWMEGAGDHRGWQTIGWN